MTERDGEIVKRCLGHSAVEKGGWWYVLIEKTYLGFLQLR